MLWVGDDAILQALVDLTAELGYAPTVREMGERVGMTSTSSIHSRLLELAENGYVSMVENSPRTLRITPEGEAWLTQIQTA